MKTPNTMREELLASLRQRVVGRDKALETIVPFVLMKRASLNPEGRPAGVFLLLGPTGTGKTRTVEALAEVLHGNIRNVLRIDCGEFHLEHETAKLIGAPPGYLGHRETQPLLTQARIMSVASRYSDISIVLFDEIEKAAGSMLRLLLGVLDKATLRLGDNNVVNFENCLIFMTSNLGADRIMKTLEPSFGFGKVETAAETQRSLENVAHGAVKRHFTPEFLNRIDTMITYEPLSTQAVDKILDLQLREFQEQIKRRLGMRAFTLHVGRETRKYLLEEGIHPQYGARHMRRALQRELIQPIADRVANGEIEPGCSLKVELSKRTRKLIFKAA